MPVTSMGRLTEEQQVFIVRRLARWRFPSDILEEFNAQWKGQRIDMSDIRANDPTNGLIDDKYLAIFKAVRAEFIANGHAFPIAEIDNQLGELQSLLEREKARGGTTAAIQGLLAQINAVASRRADDTGASNGAGITRITRTIVDPVAPAEGSAP